MAPTPPSWSCAWAGVGPPVPCEGTGTEHRRGPRSTSPAQATSQCTHGRRGLLAIAGVGSPWPSEPGAHDKGPPHSTAVGSGPASLGPVPHVHRGSALCVLPNWEHHLASYLHVLTRNRREKHPRRGGREVGRAPWGGWPAALHLVSPFCLNIMPQPD